MKAKKVLLSVVTVVVLMSIIFVFAACNKPTAVDDGAGVDIATVVNKSADYSYLTDLTGKTLKVGAITIGDETEGYTEAHINGINEAKAKIEAMGGNVNVVWKKNTPEGTECATAASELAVTNKCDLVVTNSYGHQFNLGGDSFSIVANNPNTTFISMTGDLAVASGLANYKNAFTNIYQSRYISGVVAGMKIKQLIDDNLLSDKNKDANGNIKIGYVGAHPFAEVVSGYTSFFLGIKSQVSNVTMKVQYTNSWFDYDGEYQAAKALIAEGCVVISQHADSEGAPTACEEAYVAGTRVYSVGYNVDMRKAAPHAALTSATNNWTAYYTYAFFTAMTSANGGKDIATNWAEGYAKGAVAITAINGKVFKADPSAAVKAKVDAIVDGSLKVFDCSTFTVGGKTLTTYTDSFGMNGAECLKTVGDVTFFDESTIRSAPYFDIRIDGITETGAAS